MKSFTCLLTIVAFHAGFAPAAAARPPNIVIIFTDDQGYAFRGRRNELHAVTTGDGRWKLVLPHRYEGHDRNPKIEIVDNIFYIPKPPDGMRQNYYDPMPKGCIKSENNVVIWMGDGPFPFKHKGFKVLSGAEGQAYWDEAKKHWIDAHPEVARIKGDPGYDPAKCVRNQASS